jgi:hypothetical protein
VEDLGLGGRIMSSVLKRQDEVTCTGFVWLKTEAKGRLL